MNDYEVSRHLATCSFKRFTEDMGLPVRISLGYPRWSLKYELKAAMRELMPRREYLRVDSDAEFNERYTAQLDWYGTKALAQKMDGLRDGWKADRLVLMCFEEDRVDCHRGTFADWWRDKTDVQIPEFGDGSWPDRYVEVDGKYTRLGNTPPAGGVSQDALI